MPYNKLEKVDCSIKLNDYIFHRSYTSTINDLHYTNNDIVLLIALSIYDTIDTYKQYGKFKTSDNINNFILDFSYDWNSAHQTIKKIIKIAKAFKGKKKLSEKFFEKMINLLSNGDPKQINKNKSEIIRYFDKLCISL